MATVNYNELPTEEQMSFVWRMLETEHDKDQTKMEPEFMDWINIFVNNKSKSKVDLNSLEVETKDGDIMDFQEYMALVFP